MLDDGTIAASQKDNIKAVIKMYGNGELPKRIGERIFIQDGKECEDLPDFQKGTLWCAEVCLVRTFMIHFTYYAQGYGDAAHANIGKSSPSLPNRRIRFGDFS